MSVQGPLESMIIEIRVRGDVFKTFLEEKLSPVLQTFNGVNPNSIIIMDNATIHQLCRRSSGVTGESRCTDVFPTTVQSGLNPIGERFFSKIKAYLQANEHTIHEDLETLLLMAFSSVTTQDCHGWIRHAGYC